MSMRLHRLQADWEKMNRLSMESPFIDIAADGTPPERYIVVYHCKGLTRLPGAPHPSITTLHKLEIYLHAQYPRQQPRLTWLTPIFHPNILSPEQNGGVCIGHWSPAESLAELCVRIGEMVQYKSYNPNDPLDKEAAAWAQTHTRSFPVDNRPLLAAQPTSNANRHYVEVSLP